MSEKQQQQQKKKKKKLYYTEKSNFLFLLCFKIAIFKFVPMRQPSGHISFSKRFASFDAFAVFTGYVIGCKHSLQLKNSSKLRLNKEISRNLLNL